MFPLACLSRCTQCLLYCNFCWKDKFGGKYSANQGKKIHRLTNRIKGYTTQLAHFYLLKHISVSGNLMSSYKYVCFFCNRWYKLQTSQCSRRVVIFVLGTELVWISQLFVLHTPCLFPGQALSGHCIIIKA